MFYGCSGLGGTLKVPDKVKGIGSYAFRGCTGFTDVVMGSGIKNIYSSDYSSSAFSGCTGVETITFLGSEVPVISTNLSDTGSPKGCIGFFYGSSTFRSLKTIYTMPECLEMYKSAWENYVPQTVSFSANTLNLPVPNLKTEYVNSHSVKLTWAPSVHTSVIGYHVYRDGVKLADVSESLIEDTGLDANRTYKYSVVGYTENGEETREGVQIVTTSVPEVKKIYTNNQLNKVGITNGYIYALVRNSNNLRSATGRFYYLDENEKKVLIGEELDMYYSVNSEGAIYRTEWDIKNITPGNYEVLFEIVDADGEKGNLFQTIIVDDSRPEALTNVLAVGDTNKIILSWTIAHEIDTVKYYIYRRAESEDQYTLIKKIYNRATLTYVDTKAKDNQKYFYYVTGVNSFGQEGDQSNIAVAIPLTDTENPRVVQLAPVNDSIIGGKVDIYMNAQDNVSVTKSELYFSLDGGISWSLLESEKNNYCRYTLSTGQYENKDILVKGLAYDAAGNISNPLIYTYKIDNIGPEKVKGLQYKSTATTITLKWDDVADNDFLFFRVEHKLEDGSFEKIQDVYTTLGANIYNLESEKEYIYRVVAYDQLGNRGEVSEEIAAKTKKDTMSPVITDIKPNADYFNKKIDLKITGTDDTGISSVRIQTSDNAIIWNDYKTVRFSGKGKKETVSETIVLDDFPEGNLYIRGLATDNAGNESDSTSDAPYIQYIVDRTVPEIPKNFKSTAITGAIELSWDMGSENDIEGYTIYRSLDGEVYTTIAKGLHSVNYWDRSVEKGISYWYKIDVSDRAGNVSEKTEAVKVVLPDDTEKPQIESFAPTTGSTIGPSNKKFSVMVSDNWKVDQVSVTYTVNEGSVAKTLINQTGINNYYKLLSADIPIENLNEGDLLHFTISVKDVQGLKTSKEEILYRVDKTAPRVQSISTEASKEKISIKWIGNGEADLAGYRIYRKTASGNYALIGQRSTTSETEYRYDDYNALGKETYYYKVEAIDKCGNSHAKESEAVWLIVESIVTADIVCDKVLEKDVEYYFDATKSFADLGIASYKFDFGDGEFLEGANAKVIHRYKNTGKYTVTLSIVDKTGTESRCERNITVEEPKMIGTVKIKAQDTAGNKIVGMPIYFNLDHESDNIKYTDSEGYATFIANAGSYAIGAYMNGYLPVKKSLVVQAGVEVQSEFTMVQEPIVTGKFEIDRMTLDEIKAAGIDVGNPANQQLVQVKLHLIYGSTPITMNVVTNGKDIYSGGTTIVNTDEGRRQLTATVVDTGGLGGNVSGSGVPGKTENIIIAIMDIPVEASFLKEFFDVRLHIVNHADQEFELTDNIVKLNVPEGMTLMDSNNTSAKDTMYFGALKGQEEKTLNWILRGDKAGEYDLEAEYTGVLSQFNELVSAKFKTESPITVYGLDAVKLIADINSSLLYGGMYFNLSLQNIGGADIYLPSLDVDGQIICLYEKKAGEKFKSEDDIVEAGGENETIGKNVKLLDIVLKNSGGYTQNLGKEAVIDRISAGETFTKKYVSYNAITEEDTAYLREAVEQIAVDLGIAVEVNMINMDLYSVEDADEKALSFYTDKEKGDLYNYFINNNNFNYYIDAVNDDKDFGKKLGEAFYQATDAVLSLDPEIFTHENMKEITRQYIYEMLMDESFQTATASKINDTYLKVAKSAASAVKGLLPADKSDILAENAAIQNIVDTLSEAKNIRKLAGVLRDEGDEGFYERLLTMVISAGGSTAGEVFKLYVQKNEVAGYIGDELNKQLKEVTTILDIFAKAGTAWNKSVKLTNQLVAINAAQYEAEMLLTFILHHPEINGVVYKEVETIFNGLKKGMKSQSDAFTEEFTKLLAQSGVDWGLTTVVKYLDKIYYPNVSFGASTVVAALKIAFGAFDYLFGWEDSVNSLQSLRVAGALTYALRGEVINMRVSDNNAAFLMALKYLIKMRLVGERAWVNLYEDQEIVQIKSELAGGQYQPIDKYYIAYKETILSYRDILFGEISELQSVPKAPEVDIDYYNETTLQIFDSTYEYSFNGIEWEECDGRPINLNPGDTGKHLWVRVKESKTNMSGNITKRYIPARDLISDKISVRYKNGVNYIEGLTSSFCYQLTNEKIDKISSSSIIESQKGVVEVTAGEYYNYLAIALKATNSTFRSRVLNIPVEKAKVLMVSNDNAKGTVTGAGEYFEGESVTLKIEEKTGFNFLGWYRGDTLLSENLKYTFVIHNDCNVETRYKQSEKVTVTFKGWSGYSISAESYAANLTDSSVIRVPNVAVPNGYEFKGWMLDDTLYNNNEIKKAVQERLSNAQDIKVQAKFEQEEKAYTVTVKNGKLADGKTKGTYRPSTQVTVKADAAEQGKRFAYWLKDGIIVGYEASYRFYMSGTDILLEAVYENDGSNIHAVGTTYIENIIQNIDTGKLTFVTIGNVPEGCTIEYAGIVATSDSQKAAEGKELTVSNADFVRGGGAGYKTYKYTWIKSKVTKDQTWYVRSYLKYADAAGTSHEIYGDVIAAAFKAKVMFYGWNSTNLSDKEYAFTLADPNEIEVPVAIVPNGYEFKGWMLGDTVYANGEIKEAVIEKLKESQEVKIQAKFEQKEEEHTVIVKNGKLSNGKTSERYKPSTQVIVKADAAQTGKVFAYWLKDKEIVSYEETYRFYMPETDLTLEAVYQDESEDIHALGTTYVESVIPDTAAGKLKFVTIGNVPDGCTIEYAGIVATSDPKKITDGKELTVSNADFVRGGGAGLKTYKYTWSKSKVTEGQVWYVRSYLKYSDASGDIYEVYSDIVSASLRQ